MRSDCAQGHTHFGPFFALWVLCGITPKAMCDMNIVSGAPPSPFPIRDNPAEGCRMPWRHSKLCPLPTTPDVSTDSSVFTGVRGREIL